MNWNDGSEDYNKIWDLKKEVKRLQELLAHVGCGSLDEVGLCKDCDEIRKRLK